MKTLFRSSVAAFAAAGLFVASVACAEEAPIDPVIETVRASRTLATVEVTNRGTTGFRIEAQMEFVDSESGLVVAVVSFPAMVVPSASGSRVTLEAPMPGRDVLPKIAYLTRVVAEAAPIAPERQAVAALP